MQYEPWVRQLIDCDPEILPQPFTWHIASRRVATFIDGYGLMEELGVEISKFSHQKIRDYSLLGVWRGSALELWVCMFFFQRQDHFGAMTYIPDSETMRRIADDDRKREKDLDKLCETFRLKFTELSRIDRIALARCRQLKKSP